MTKKVLLIENDVAFSEKFSQALENEGFIVIRSIDGKEGLAKAFAEKPDLIIVRAYLPVMTGFAFIQELRKIDWGKRIPTFVLATSLNEKEMVRSLSGNYDYFLIEKSSIPFIVKKVKEKLV